MQFIYSIILGIIQGLTEFLPISSSGHLVIFHDILKFELTDNLAFDAALHLGTLLALIIFFGPEIRKYLGGFFRSFKNWNLKEDINQRLAWYIFLSSIPAGIVGYFFEDFIKEYFRSVFLVSLMLILVGILFILFERIFKKIKNLEELSLKNSLIIGFFQVLAFIPGVSRSGITIIAGLSQKLKREVAARFSFLLGIPVILGAGIKKIIDLSSLNIASGEILLIILGSLSATLTGYFCIKFLLGYLQNHSLNIFAVYRIILGLILIICWLGAIL